MMLRFNPRTWVWSGFVALTAVSGSSAYAGKTVPPGRVLPKGGADQVQKNPSPQAPEPKGWPHAILTASATNCAREPAAHEVIVYNDPGFAGKCAIMVAGLYPYASNLVVGDNTISSIKVGSGVRARLFLHPTYGGAWNVYAPGTRSGGLGNFNDTITSMRVEPANRSETCDDLREGEIALFEHPYGRGDCMVLPGEGSYANPDSMGIRDDGISSMHNNSSRKLIGFADPGFASNFGMEVAPHKNAETMPTDGLFNNGIDDDISSVQMVQP